MKISKLFHWLYFAVMMLPIFLIPIFAVYSHRHDVSQDLEVTEEVPVYYESNEVDSWSDISIDHIYSWNDNFEITSQQSSRVDLFKIEPSLTKSQFNLDSVQNCNTFIITYGTSGNIVLVGDNTVFINLNDYVFYFIPLEVYSVNPTVQSLFLPHISSTDYLYFKEFQEVTTFLPQDVMTSFVNRYAEAIDKYFNYDSVFNFGSLYSWLEFNFFSGTAPLGFFIFWHLLIYWLLTSLIWLIFDVLMYVPLLVHRWLDKASIS